MSMMSSLFQLHGEGTWYCMLLACVLVSLLKIMYILDGEVESSELFQLKTVP
jgi:hypothetical protein